MSVLGFGYLPFKGSFYLGGHPYAIFFPVVEPAVFVVAEVLEVEVVEAVLVVEAVEAAGVTGVTAAVVAGLGSHVLVAWLSYSGGLFVLQVTHAVFAALSSCSSLHASHTLVVALDFTYPLTFEGQVYLVHMPEAFL